MGFVKKEKFEGVMFGRETHFRIGLGYKGKIHSYLVLLKTKTRLVILRRMSPEKKFSTAGDAIQQVVKAKQKSNRINYDVLTSLKEG